MRKIITGLILFMLVFIPLKVKAVQNIIIIDGNDIDLGTLDYDSINRQYSMMDGKVIIEDDEPKITLTNYTGGPIYYETTEDFLLTVNGENTVNCGDMLFCIGSYGGIVIDGEGTLNLVYDGEETLNTGIAYSVIPGETLSRSSGTDVTRGVIIKNKKTTISGTYAGIYTLSNEDSFDDSIIESELTMDTIFCGFNIYGTLKIQNSKLTINSGVNGIAANKIVIDNSDVKVTTLYPFGQFSGGLSAYYGGGININKSTLDIIVPEGVTPIVASGEKAIGSGGITLDSDYEAIGDDKKLEIMTIDYINSYEDEYKVTTFASGEFTYVDQEPTYDPVAGGVPNHLIIRKIIHNPETIDNVNLSIISFISSLICLIGFSIYMKAKTV